VRKRVPFIRPTIRAEKGHAPSHTPQVAGAFRPSSLFSLFSLSILIPGASTVTVKPCPSRFLSIVFYRLQDDCGRRLAPLRRPGPVWCVLHLSCISIDRTEVEGGAPKG